MARRSGSSGSYREWEAAQRAEQRAADQAAKRAEQQQKAVQHDRDTKDAAARDKEAAARTMAIEHRAATFQGLLQSSLMRDPTISIALLRRRIEIPPLDLGPMTVPLPAPQWAASNRSPPGDSKHITPQHQSSTPREAHPHSGACPDSEYVTTI